MVDKLHRITVSWAGDKQSGFSRKGINSNASKDAMNILRGIFTFKGYSFKKSFLYRLRVDKRIENKKQALLAPATCTMINGLHKRVMAFFASCEQFRYSKRFDSWNENISILTLYMGGDHRSWRKVQ
jgi:hypothetical protein